MTTDATTLPHDATPEQIKEAIQDFHKDRAALEKKAHAIFAAQPVGNDRTKWAEIYDNVRNCTRVF